MWLWLIRMHQWALTQRVRWATSCFTKWPCLLLPRSEIASDGISSQKIFEQETPLGVVKRSLAWLQIHQRSGCQCEPQIWEKGGVRGSEVVPIESQPMISQYLSIESECLSLTVFELFQWLSSWHTYIHTHIHVRMHRVYFVKLALTKLNKNTKN